ncbi:MAG: hypothetical protein R3Y32_03000 [Bacillota bacterium]
MKNQSNQTTNARRFLESYNKLDADIRGIFNLYPRSTFSDAIRKSAEISPLVRKHEDDLLSYAKLRNAIVHDSEEGKIIAEPLLEVTVQFENIVNAILTPKTISACNFGKKVNMLSGEECAKDATVEIFQSGFSNLPVFYGGKIIGVFSNKRVVEIVAMAVKKQKSIDELLSCSKVKDCVFLSDKGKYYEIVSENARIDEILKLYEKNPNLALVIVTKTGSAQNKPTQVVAPSDVTTLSAMLESY